MAEIVKVAETKDIPPGEGIAVEVKDERIAIFNVEGKFYAITDTCPHMGGPLSEGFADEDSVTCPWHGWNFEFEDPGEDDGVTRYPVHVDGDDIKIELP